MPRQQGFFLQLQQHNGRAWCALRHKGRACPYKKVVPQHIPRKAVYNGQHRACALSAHTAANGQQKMGDCEKCRRPSDNICTPLPALCPFALNLDPRNNSVFLECIDPPRKLRAKQDFNLQTGKTNKILGRMNREHNLRAGFALCSFALQTKIIIILYWTIWFNKNMYSRHHLAGQSLQYHF